MSIIRLLLDLNSIQDDSFIVLNSISQVIFGT